MLAFNSTRFILTKLESVDPNYRLTIINQTFIMNGLKMKTNSDGDLPQLAVLKMTNHKM